MIVEPVKSQVAGTVTEINILFTFMIQGQPNQLYQKKICIASPVLCTRRVEGKDEQRKHIFLNKSIR